MESTNGTTPAKKPVMKKAVRLRTPILAPPVSRYHMSCGSELARKRKRWSPYDRKGNCLPTKSVSLETLSLSTAGNCASLDDAFLAGPGIPTIGWEVDCNEIVSKVGNEKASTSKEWSALVVCARMMKAAWRKTRDALAEQVYRAENSELQAKSTLMQVFSMKSQLKDDICKMRERVKEINATSVLLDEKENDKTKLLAENQFLKTKIDCLSDERDSLSRSLVNIDQETKIQDEKMEKMVTQALEYKKQSADLKQMKTSLDNTIREMMANAEVGEETLSTLKNIIRNLEMEVADGDRALKDWNQRISDTILAMKATENQSKAIRAEIKVATDGGLIVQEQLIKLQKEVVERDTVIGKLNEKVEAAAAQLAAMKTRVQLSERTVWQRMRAFPSTDSVIRSII